MTRLRRLAFLVAVLAFPLVVPAAPPQATRPAVIGYLAVASKQAGAHFFEAFKAGMSERGYREGRDYVLEARWADGDNARLAALAGEIAARKPALVVAAPTQAVAAAHKAMPAIAIVQANGSDPTDAGFAKSLSRPGGMVTGVTNVISDTSDKHITLLRQAVPGVRRVGFIYEPSVAGAKSAASARTVAQQANLEGRFEPVSSPAELPAAIAALAKDGAQALVILSGGFFPSERKRILGLAKAQGWPVIGGLREYAEDGALLAYGADRTSLYRRSAQYVDQILNGARPGDLPIEQPSQFELVVNRAAARTLGVSLPQELLLRADRVLD